MDEQTQATPPAAGCSHPDSRIVWGRWIGTPDEIRDRVLADIAARPSIRPYLTEVYEEPKVGHRPRRETCRQGHPITGEGKARRCLECWRAWRERRAGVDG